MKYRKVDVPPSNPTTGPPTIRKKKDRKSIIVVGSVLLVFVGALCLGIFFIYRKKIMKGLRRSEISLRSLTYKELDVATKPGEELAREAIDDANQVTEVSEDLLSTCGGPMVREAIDDANQVIKVSEDLLSTRGDPMKR